MESVRGVGGGFSQAVDQPCIPAGAFALHRGAERSWVDAIASDGLQDDLITIAIDKENSLPDDKA